MSALFYKSGAPAPLTQAERAMLPADMAFLDCARYSTDHFDNREFQLDAIQQQRAWIAEHAPQQVAA